MAFKFLNELTPEGKRIFRGDAAPSAATGTTFRAGDLILYNGGDSRKPIGWRCTTAGDPGTWEQVGVTAIEVRYNIAAGAVTGDFDGVQVVDPLHASKLAAVRMRYQTASSAAETLMVKKVPSGTAKASGTDCLAAGMALNGSADTNISGTLHATAANTEFAAGDGVGLVASGTPTALDGVGIVLIFVRR